MKPPVVGFVAFHSSRVPALRRWREEAVRKFLAEKKSVRVAADKKPKKVSEKSPVADAALLAQLPAGLDPATQRMILEALRKRR